MKKPSTGVYFQKKSKRFIAKPWLAKRAYYIGSFKTEQEAEQAVREFKEKNSHLSNYDSDMDCGDPYLELNRMADSRKLPLAEIKIRCAILQQSIDDIKNGNISQKMSAAYWMMQEDTTYSFSFSSIADTIGIDSIKIKNAIFNSHNIKEEEVEKYVQGLLQSGGGVRASRGSGFSFSWVHGSRDSGSESSDPCKAIRQDGADGRCSP